MQRRRPTLLPAWPAVTTVPVQALLVVRLLLLAVLPVPLDELVVSPARRRWYTMARSWRGSIGRERLLRRFDDKRQSRLDTSRTAIQSASRLVEPFAARHSLVPGGHGRPRVVGRREGAHHALVRLVPTLQRMAVVQGAVESSQRAGNDPGRIGRRTQKAT